jgi:hypothetical protein
VSTVVEENSSILLDNRFNVNPSALTSPMEGDWLLLDAEKAFDSVWHEALLHKLLVNGWDNFVARFFFSLLKNRSFLVCIGKSKSSFYDIPYGVPQGAIYFLCGFLRVFIVLVSSSRN